MEKDIEGPRKGRRVVVYPKELEKLEQVLEAGDPSIDTEDGHAIAYSAILQESQNFEIHPVFVKEDNPAITGNPEISQLVPGLMNTAHRVATGSRQRVLEDGRDVMNSDDEDAIADVKPDEELNMDTAGMDPKKGPIMLSARKVAKQRAIAAAVAQKAADEARIPPRPQTPADGSSDDDDPNGADLIWSQSRRYYRQNKNKPKSVPPMRTPEP
jgi:hypothetical protein